MSLFFTSAEASLLLRLLIAHCLTDFLLQPGKWIAGKKKDNWRSKYLLYHILLTGAIAWLFVWDGKLWWAILCIMATHYIIDGYKIATEARWGNKNGKGLLWFLSDQLLHIIVIIIVWLSIIRGWQQMSLLWQAILSGYSFWLYLLGYIIMAGPVGFIIQLLTRKWTAELNPQDSLPDAGRWIGILERILTITFVYINQFSAIGFLIAAKSILRVFDKPDKPGSEPTLTKPFSSRKHTEYVVIGTFLSFAMAILTGLIINRLAGR